MCDMKHMAPNSGHMHACLPPYLSQIKNWKGIEPPLISDKACNDLHWLVLLASSQHTGVVCSEYRIPKDFRTVEIVALGLLGFITSWSVNIVTPTPLHILMESNQYPTCMHPYPNHTMWDFNSLFTSMMPTQPNQNKTTSQIIKINTTSRPCS